MTSDGGDRFLDAPRFDVVLRGYDRRQVDDHIARLQRVVVRLRAELDASRSQPLPPSPMPPRTPSRGFPPPGYAPPAPRPHPTPRPRPEHPPRPDQPQPRSAPTPPAQAPDIVGGFTDRMQSILRAAEEEAAEIRRQARLSTRGDDHLRSQVAGLVDERNAMLAELTRMRNQLEGLTPPPVARSNPQPTHGGLASPPPVPQPARPAGDVAAGEQGMRRFPEGAFRAPGDRVDSLRPRSMPGLEPNKLFDPTSDESGEPESDDGARQAGADGSGEASGGNVDQAGSPPPSGSDVEATVPAPQHPPAAAASADGATDHHDDASANGSPDEPPADEAQTGVTNGVGRPASTSWSR